MRSSRPRTTGSRRRARRRCRPTRSVAEPARGLAKQFVRHRARRTLEPARSPTMTEFVYLWRRPPRPPQTPQQMQAWMQKYQAWFKDMEARGHLAQYGQPLEPTLGRVVKDAAGSFSDGPYAET